MRSSDREPIEIQLVPEHSPDSPFAPPGGATGEPSATGDRRVLVVASVVAVIALALGWMLGRSASGGTDDLRLAVGSTVPNEPVEAAATTALGALAPVPTTAPATTPPATAAPTSAPPAVGGASGDDAERVVEQIEVAAALDGEPVEIVTYGNGRRLQRLDLRSGTLVTQQVERPPFGRPRLILGDGWVMLPAADPAQPTIVVDDGGEVGETTSGPILQIPGTSDGPAAWVMAPELAGGAAGTLERRPRTSGVDAEVLFLPGPPSRVDPRGGFVVDAPGGSYRVDADGATRITDGELIALGREVAVADECDDALACSVVVIDRSTGERRALGVERPLDDSQLASFAIAGSASVAPDGSQALVRIVNSATQLSNLPTLGVVDLVNGAVVEVGPVQDIDRVVWSPDARFLFFDRGGKVLAYERATGERHVVSEALLAIDTFAVRAVTGP